MIAMRETGNRIAIIAAAACALCAGALLLPLATAQAPYLPRTVAAFEVCRKAALAEYPGEVVRVSTRVTADLFRIRVTISQREDRELVVICDGTSGQIVRVVRIDEEAPGANGIK